MLCLRWWWLALVIFLPLQIHGQDLVVLQLKWRHQFQFAGYYAAIEQGYYRDAGLEVELREAQPGHDPLHEVLDGHADFGVGTSNIVLWRAQGHPIVVLAVIYQHSPFVILTAEQSGVDDIHGLADKPIMMEPDAAELLAYFKNEGVDPSTLKILPHSFNGLDLVKGSTVGMSAYSTDEPFHLKQAGIRYNTFTPRASGIDFYGDNLFTTEKQIREHPERVKAFLQASLRGWEYAMKHQEEMVDLILRQYNRGKTREQLLFEAEETADLVHPELIGLGYINPGRWQNIARTYADLGMIPENSLSSLKGFVYNPQRNWRWLWFAGGGLLLLALGVTGWTVLTARLNRKLRREIEARTRAEEVARRQNEAKTNFLAVLAHEVRTPLSGILSSLWLLRESETEAERTEVLDIAEESSSNLLLMVDKILDQAKLESGHMVAEFLPVAVRDFLGEILKLYRASAASKSIGIDLQIDPALPETITTDPTKLRQILSNLISNAVKFTATGSVHITAAPGPENELIFRVTDTGPGLTPEQIRRIFEPYAQAASDVARRYGGTGLGLAISRQLAHLLGGDITVESTPGQGATFILKIKAQPPA